MSEFQINVKTTAFEVNGIQLVLQDVATSGTLEVIKKDIEQNAYGINELHDPTLILDLGAHVGMVSIYLAKKFPNAKIIAVEPFPINLVNFVKNLEINECKNVAIVPKAITGDARLIDLGCVENNTGGCIPDYGHGKPHIESWTLNTLFERLIPPTEQVSFIKMDIEGFEFEVLPTFTHWEQVKDAGIELHNKLGSMGAELPQIKETIEWLKTKPIKGRLWTPPLEAFIA